MIDLYRWPTPNGHKVTLFLDEAQVRYTLKPVNIGKGKQFQPDFLAISPNNRMPAIVDHAPLERGGAVSVFESGAILWYLADKTEQFIPADARGHIQVPEWQFWQGGGLGPMAGQNHHFNRYSPEKDPVRDRTLRQGNGPPVRRDGPAAGGTRVPRRRTRSPTWPPIRGWCRIRGRGEPG